MQLTSSGDHRPHIIVLGNEKGGSGKSTTAMHIVIALLGEGRRVAALDLDSRQRSLTRYLENRQKLVADKGLPLAVPAFAALARSAARDLAGAEAEEQAAFDATLAGFSAEHDCIVIDCPGSDTHLSRLAHGVADTLITPLNDSFVDLDLLARVDRDSFEITGPSLYAEMVWEARKRRALRDRGQIDWIVMRNRVATLNARNKAQVERVLAKLAKRIGFRFLPGLSERVIYRELFLKGLTLGDLRSGRAGTLVGGLTMSQVAARQELRRLVDAINLPPARPRLEAAE